MKKVIVLSLMVLSIGLLEGTNAPATAVTPEEQSEAHQWAAAKFEGATAAGPSIGYLRILDKKGEVEKNESPGGPLRIAKENYRRGLYTGSVTKLEVHLPDGGKTFEAVAGLGLDWFGCGASSGSAVYSVEVGGKEIFRSAIATVGNRGLPLNVALGGATDFVLVAGTPEKKPPCPANVWAEARVKLTNDKTVWLDELPVTPVRAPYTTEAPFSFIYGGKPSGDLLKSWSFERQIRRLDAQRTEYTLTYKDPQTGLEVRSVGVEYHDFPSVEWTLYFENTGTVDTPILEDIQALNTRLERNGEGEFILHHFKGSQTTPIDYEPFETRLGANQSKRITTSGGRPTNSDLCYFDIEWPGEGVIVALGWPGQWAAEFRRDEGQGLQVRAGQELTHFKLNPAEKVRTPLVALLFWKGDWIRAQNLWRRWMLVHNLPREGGKPLAPASWTENTLFFDYTNTSEANQESFISQYQEKGLKTDYWEMDAGWYVNDGHWWNTGTWEPDPKRFPHGLGPVFDFMHAHHLKTHIWFEVERVTKGTWLWENHPEWLLKGPDAEEDGQRLLNLGDPRAYKWVIETLDKYISEGIDFYRTDFNFDPLPYWRANDAPDRQGITEIKYVTAFLAYFDELLRRHANLLIDTCASGGRRNDLETLRRAIPITRSDYGLEPVGDQNITYGIAFWMPVYGAGTLASDLYTIRSSWAPRYGFSWDMELKNLDYSFMRRMIREWHEIADYFFGDYYPLTPYNSTNSAWMAWQFDRPDLGMGMVQAFRRAESQFELARVKLRGLDSDARYTLTNLDIPGTTEMTGRQLMDEGLLVSTKAQPQAVIITYRRMQAGQ